MPLRLVVPLLLLVPLAACTMGRPKERINPPTLSVQELRVEAGQCLLRLRLHNHSTVRMRFSDVELATLDLGGRALGPLVLAPGLDVPPTSAEPFDHVVPCPGLDAAAGEHAYHLAGRIVASEPRGQRFQVSWRSRLLPVPGLAGVYR